MCVGLQASESSQFTPTRPSAPIPPSAAKISLTYAHILRHTSTHHITVAIEESQCSTHCTLSHHHHLAAVPGETKDTSPLAPVLAPEFERERRDPGAPVPRKRASLVAPVAPSPEKKAAASPLAEPALKAALGAGAVMGAAAAAAHGHGSAAACAAGHAGEASEGGPGGREGGASGAGGAAGHACGASAATAGAAGHVGCRPSAAAAASGGFAGHAD